MPVGALDIDVSAGTPPIDGASVHSVPILGQIGNLQTRLATTRSEIDAALAVRYKVFCLEMGAQLPTECVRNQQDYDRFDAVCDHLLVLDTDRKGSPEEQVVGTYRLLPSAVAAAHDGFYSAGEFEISSLLDRNPDKNFMELGRSCVLPGYRTKRTVELLWQGNWAYARRNNIDVMFGCASFAGRYPAAFAEALSFLHHTCRAEGSWAVRALPRLAQTMDLMPFEAVKPRRALAAMPPLVKGYLRLGACIGDGAVIDTEFNTTDVLIVLPIEQINTRYINHYGADAERFGTSG